MGGDSNGTTGNNPGGGLDLNSMGMDPSTMRQLMAMQYLSNATGNLGAIDARRRGQPYQQPQAPNPLASILPLMQMQALGLQAEDRTKKLADEKAQASAYYGPYSTQAGAKPWANPDGNSFMGPSYNFADGKASPIPDAQMGKNDQTVPDNMRGIGGIVGQAPPDLQSILRSMTPDKGTAFMADLAKENAKPPEYGTPIGAVGPDGKPVLLMPGKRGDVKMLPDYTPSPKSMADGAPSNVQEWQFFNGLSKDDQERYLTMKRANQQLNLGGSIAVPSQVNPGGPPQASFTKTVPPQDTPENAAAVEAAKRTADNTVTAQANLPTATDNANYMLNLLDQVAKPKEGGGYDLHPGFKAVVGLPDNPLTGIPAKMGIPIPGTDAGNFKVLMDQIGGKQFLQAYDNLKGAGQITEVEGKKATDAIARMNTAQDEPEFLKALDEFRGVVRQAKGRAQMKAGGGAAAPANGGWSITLVP